jgi:hypothetical protein
MNIGRKIGRIPELREMKQSTMAIELDIGLAQMPYLSYLTGNTILDAFHWRKSSFLFSIL